jgi:hypothetical protein
MAMDSDPLNDKGVFSYLILLFTSLLRPRRHKYGGPSPLSGDGSPPLTSQVMSLHDLIMHQRSLHLYQSSERGRSVFLKKPLRMMAICYGFAPASAIFDATALLSVLYYSSSEGCPPQRVVLLRGLRRLLEASPRRVEEKP